MKMEILLYKGVFKCSQTDLHMFSTDISCVAQGQIWVSVCSPVDGAPSSGILFWVDNSASLMFLPFLNISFHQSGAQDGTPEKQHFQGR